MRNLTLLFSLVILLVACGEKDKTKSDSKPKIEARKLDGLKIAYYSNDSIKEYFEYYKREDAAVTKKQKAFQAEIDKRTSELQNYVQRKDQEARSGLLSQNEIGMASMFAVLSAESKGLDTAFCACIRNKSEIATLLGHHNSEIPIVAVGIGHRNTTPGNTYFNKLIYNTKNVPDSNYDIRPAMTKYVRYHVA